VSKLEIGADLQHQEHTTDPDDDHDRRGRCSAEQKDGPAGKEVTEQRRPENEAGRNLAHDARLSQPTRQLVGEAAAAIISISCSSVMKSSFSVW
jgi:hypothetical protein